MAKHLLAVKELTPSTWQLLIQDTLQFSSHKSKSNFENLFLNKHAALLFMEPSTRTQLSFSLACSKLGIQTHLLLQEGSSLSKGESLEDTFLNMEAMGLDLIIARIKEEKILESISKKLKHLNIICAGEGKKSHPSQALLDACTIFTEFKKFDDLRILFIGDIEHSRVYQSNVEWMQWFSKEIYHVSPKSNSIFNISKNCKEDSSWDDMLPYFDVIIMLRPQLERHESNIQFSPSDYHEKFGINKRRFEKISKKCILMHPGPFYQNVEFEHALLTQPNFKIYDQVKFGVFARMSILKYVLEYKNET